MWAAQVWTRPGLPDPRTSSPLFCSLGHSAIVDTQDSCGLANGAMFSPSWSLRLQDDTGKIPRRLVGVGTISIFLTWLPWGSVPLVVHLSHSGVPPPRHLAVTSLSFFDGSTVGLRVHLPQYLLADGKCQRLRCVGRWGRTEYRLCNGGCICCGLRNRVRIRGRAAVTALASLGG
jgi:hypothetical protein